jgi:hypothetical protein
VFAGGAQYVNTYSEEHQTITQRKGPPHIFFHPLTPFRLFNFFNFFFQISHISFSMLISTHIYKTSDLSFRILILYIYINMHV